MRNALDSAASMREQELAVRRQVWKDRYERLIQIMEAEATRSAGKNSERRQFPRVDLPEGSRVFVHGEPTAHEIHDVSAGGLSYYSDARVELGQLVTLSAKGILSLQVIVRGCELEEVDSTLMEYRYRVRAEFTSDVNGYQAFVLACEIFGKTPPSA